MGIFKTSVKETLSFTATFRQLLNSKIFIIHLCEIYLENENVAD